MHYTREQLDTLLERAVAAVRITQGAPGDPMHLIVAREDAAQRSVVDAVRAGIHHRQIAELSGVSGLRVLGYLTDVDLSNAALRAERHHAERYTGQVMDEIRGRALYLANTGAQKTDICAALGITRPTLDAWIRAASEEAGSNDDAEGFRPPRLETHPTDLAKARRYGAAARRLREEQEKEGK